MTMWSKYLYDSVTFQVCLGCVIICTDPKSANQSWRRYVDCLLLLLLLLLFSWENKADISCESSARSCNSSEMPSLIYLNANRMSSAAILLCALKVKYLTAFFFFCFFFGGGGGDFFFLFIFSGYSMFVCYKLLVAWDNFDTDVQPEPINIWTRIYPKQRNQWFVHLLDHGLISLNIPKYLFSWIIGRLS